MYNVGADPGFCEGGSEPRKDLEGIGNPSIVSLKQGSGGLPFLEAAGYFCLALKSHSYNARLACF